MATLATLDSEAQWHSAKFFPGQAKMAVGLLGRCAVTSRSHPKREGSRCLAVELASKAGAGVGRVLDRADSLLLERVAGDVAVVLLPL